MPRFDPAVITAARITDQIVASIGGRNSFDEMPDVDCPFTDEDGDDNGAFFYARLNVNF